MQGGDVEFMQKIFRSWRLISGMLFFFALSIAIPVNASSIAAPSLLKINSFKSYSLAAPVVSGVTAKDTNVLVYIDDVFVGNAEVKKTNTVSDSFFYQAFNLSEGKHTAYLVAEDKIDLSRSQNSVAFELEVAALAAPTLVVPNKNTITGKIKPLIEGFVKSGSFAHIYIDGVYNGKTNITENVSGTAHFSYTPYLGLALGNHKMWAISEDINGRKSLVSKVVEFNIEDKMPAPTLLSSAQNKISTQINIKGLAKNNSKIKIYIDQKLDGEFMVKNHKSGTANFSYTSKKITNNHKHMVFATAVDARGKESLWSNIIFDSRVVARPKVLEKNITSNGKVTENAAVEETPATPKTETESSTKIKDYLTYSELYKTDNSLRLNDGQYKELESLLSKGSELKISNNEISDLEKLLATKNIDGGKVIESKEEPTKETELNLDDVLKNDQASTSKDKGGLIDEKKDQQGKLGWNAFIFILFLFAVIAWIFWVNRELIKEKKEQEEKEKNEEEKKN